MNLRTRKAVFSCALVKQRASWDLNVALPFRRWKSTTKNKRGEKIEKAIPETKPFSGQLDLASTSTQGPVSADTWPHWHCLFWKSFWQSAIPSFYLSSSCFVVIWKQSESAYTIAWLDRPMSRVVVCLYLSEELCTNRNSTLIEPCTEVMDRQLKG